MTVSLQKVEQDTLFEIILAANYLDIKVAYIIQEPEHHSPSISKSLREGVQKKPFLLDFVPNYGQVGVQSPNLFSENNHSVILTANPLFLGLCPRRGLAVGGWGSRVPNKYIEFCPKNLSLFQKKNKIP